MNKGLDTRRKARERLFIYIFTAAILADCWQHSGDASMLTVYIDLHKPAGVC